MIKGKGHKENCKCGFCLDSGDFKKGCNPWNKGLKKETDERVLNYSKKLSEIKKGNVPICAYNKYFGKENSFHGKKHTNKTKQKIRDFRLGKKNPEQSRRMSGKNNPTFNDWSSLKPYDKNFNDKFKDHIKKRDNNCCLVCMKHKDKLKNYLMIHHINYDKELTIPQNCITLCSSCHMKTNFNRNSWIKFFQSLLSEKYGYFYSINREIILKPNKFQEDTIKC